MKSDILQNVLYEICKKNKIDINDYDKYYKYNYHKIDLLMISYFNNGYSMLKDLLLSELKTECNNYLNYRIALDELVRIFNENNIDFILVKGLSLNSIYTFPIVRKFKDIDLIVDFKQLSLAEKSLKENGYIQGYYNSDNNTIKEASKKEIIFSKMYKHETVNLVKIQNGIPVNIDLNFLFQWKGFDNQQIPFDELIKNSHIEHNLNCRILKKIYLFLHLCCHYYNETTRFVFSNYSAGEPTNEIKLFRIVDMILLLSDMTNNEIIELINCSKKHKLENQVVYCIKTMEAFSQSIINDDLKKFCKENDSVVNNLNVYMTKTGSLKLWPIDIYTRIFDLEYKNEIVKNMNFID